ncbi:biofilm development regulator YmgB/AriR family protein [Type-D symbiont of Plautia stali]|uniref:biofilm development regulator YmgB/AriR family protein n=1 Tax=Type-D symbiont of Plautia stali TaxID=1560356 RepID=UPI00073F8C44|nr:biofilm development regulator YmgB/AriR family protein [Type-D symbiont of Plautia stali]
MQQNKTEEEILSVLNQYGDQLAAESEIISEVFHHLKLNGGRVVRKDVILCLIAELESTSDVVRLDVLRGALEIVVGCSHESDND